MFTRNLFQESFQTKLLSVYNLMTRSIESSIIMTIYSSFKSYHHPNNRQGAGLSSLGDHDHLPRWVPHRLLGLEGA